MANGAPLALRTAACLFLSEQRTRLLPNPTSGPACEFTPTHPTRAQQEESLWQAGRPAHRQEGSMSGFSSGEVSTKDRPVHSPFSEPDELKLGHSVSCESLGNREGTARSHGAQQQDTHTLAR